MYYYYALANFNDTKELIAQMEEWEIRQDERTKIQYKSLCDPAKALAYEDLFRFEYSTDSEYISQQNGEAWCAFFLQTFGDIKAPIVERVLLEYKNSRPPRSLHEETIYNFDDVKKKLRDQNSMIISQDNRGGGLNWYFDAVGSL